MGADLNRPSQHIIAMATPQRIIDMTPYMGQLLKLVHKLRWVDYVGLFAAMGREPVLQVILREAETWAQQSAPQPGAPHAWDIEYLQDQFQQGIPLIRRVVQAVQHLDRAYQTQVRRGDLYEPCEAVLGALVAWLRLMKDLSTLVNVHPTGRTPRMVPWATLARDGLRIIGRLRRAHQKGLYEEIRRVQRRWALVKQDLERVQAAVDHGTVIPALLRAALQRLRRRWDVGRFPTKKAKLAAVARKVLALLTQKERRLAPQLTELHARKGQLKRAMYAEASRAVARVLLKERASLLAIEDLQVTPRGKWRTLAKYVIDMLSQLGFMDRAAEVASHYHHVGTGLPVEDVAIGVVRVNPAGTSQYCAIHSNARLKQVAGTWDIQYCLQGDHFVARHGNSSQRVAANAAEILQGGVP